jgi:hypothetical protein
MATSSNHGYLPGTGSGRLDELLALAGVDPAVDLPGAWRAFKGFADLPVVSSDSSRQLAPDRLDFEWSHGLLANGRAAHAVSFHRLIPTEAWFGDGWCNIDDCIGCSFWLQTRSRRLRLARSWRRRPAGRILSAERDGDASTPYRWIEEVEASEGFALLTQGLPVLEFRAGAESFWD